MFLQFFFFSTLKKLNSLFTKNTFVYTNSKFYPKNKQKQKTKSCYSASVKTQIVRRVSYCKYSLQWFITADQ